MTDVPGAAITPDTVRAAAALAGLPLPEARVAEVTALLAAWVPAANALSTRMQSDDVCDLMPAVVFTQGPADHDEDGGTGA